jgi:hypothetical protein
MTADMLGKQLPLAAASPIAETKSPRFTRLRSGAI